MTNPFRSLGLTVVLCAGALGGCGGSNASSGVVPPQAAFARVRFIDGAPSLETLIAGVPQSICAGASLACYLQVNGQTVASTFAYGTISNFTTLPAGALSLKALDTLGYFVGPLKTPSLSAGKRYSLIVVGTYPNYQVLALEEPSSGGRAQLSLYEASPSVPTADFGSFRASSRSNFRKLGSAHFGSVATVTLGKSVSNFGGYVAAGSNQIGALTLAQIDSFDSRNALPFHRAARLSLFLFDTTGGSTGPVFGSIDQ